MAVPNPVLNLDRSTDTATGSTTARTLADRFADVLNAADFGVVGNGLTDNTSKLNDFFAALGPGVRGVLPRGTINFSSGLTIAAQGYALVGAGDFQTVLRYTGASTTTDLLVIGSASQTINVVLEGFRLTSSTHMTGGAALHMRNLCRSVLQDVIVDGEDAAAFNLYHGFWFDGVDQVTLANFQSCCQGDGVRVNGTVGAGPKAGLFISAGKIGSCGVGLHIGGAFGGIYVAETDVIGNGQNCVIDTALAAEGNREIFLGDTTTWDSATTGAGIYVNDALAASAWLSIGGWVASSHTSGIHIVNWAGWVSIPAGTIFNNTLDGVRVETTAAGVVMGAQTVIRNNGGWGVNATVPVTQVFPGSVTFAANALGSVSANVAGFVGLWGDTTVFGTLASRSSVTIGSNAAAADQSLTVNAAAGYNKQIALQSGGVARWSVFSDAGAESGGNAGSQFTIAAYSDAGTFLSNPLAIRRSDGAVFMPGTTNIGSTSGASLLVGNNGTSSTSYTTYNGTAASFRGALYQTAGVLRWGMYVAGGTEGGANAGSDLQILAYSDVGASIATPLIITRATGTTMLTALAVGTTTGPTIRSGTGAASGTQPKGSIWMRTDGAVGTTMYVSQGAGTWNPVAGV